MTHVIVKSRANGVHNDFAQLRRGVMLDEDCRFARHRLADQAPRRFASHQRCGGGRGGRRGQAECARFVTERKIAVDKASTNRWTLEQGDEA